MSYDRVAPLDEESVRTSSDDLGAYRRRRPLSASIWASYASSCAILLRSLYPILYMIRYFNVKSRGTGITPDTPAS